MEAIIDGESYPYVKRSLPKLLGGLVLFATGLSLVESSNETTQNAVNWYNKRLKENGLGFKIGESSQKLAAIRFNF